MSGQQQIPVIQNCSFGGISFNASVILSADIVVSAIVSVAVAQAGVLTTRTDANTGTLTMTSASHGITTGARLDVYWSGGRRRGMTVGTVSGTSVPIDLGAGTDLPAADTAITASVPVKRAMRFTNANLALFGATCDGECQFTFVENDSATETYALYLAQPASAGQFSTSVWHSSSGVALPFSGTDTEYVWVSQGGTTAARNMSTAALTN